MGLLFHYIFLGLHVLNYVPGLPALCYRSARSSVAWPILAFVITHILPALQRSLNQRFRVTHFYFGRWLATHPYGQTVCIHITAEVESLHVASGCTTSYFIEETIHVRLDVVLERGTQTRLKDGRHLR